MKTMFETRSAAVVVALLAAEAAVGDEAVGAHDLLDDLGGRHVAGEPRLAGGAERAVHAAAGLRRHAQRDAAGVAHEHRLDEGAVVQLPQELDRVAAVGLEAPHLGQQRRQHPVDELLATLGGKVGHVGRVVGPVGEVVLLELLRAEAGEAELLDLRDALVGRQIGEVDGRLAALRARELQQRPALGILLLLPSLGRRSHLADARERLEARSCLQGRGRTCAKSGGSPRCADGRRVRESMALARGSWDISRYGAFAAEPRLQHPHCPRLSDGVARTRRWGGDA